MNTERARWSRSRGTAFAELAIVAPIFMIAWASINHFRSNYLMAQQVLHESRTQAWARATSGQCNAGVIPSPLLALGGNLGTFGDEALGIFELANQGGILDATGTVDAKVGRAGPTPSKFSYLKKANEIGGRSFMHCNDPLPSPDDSVPIELPLGFQYLKPSGVE